MEQRYEYFAIVTETRPQPEDPDLVCRRRLDADGQSHDEAFTTRLRWEPSTALIEVEVHPGAVHRVDAAAAERFEQAQRELMAYIAPPDGQYSYLVWVDTGSTVDDPDAVLRTWPGPRGGTLDEHYVAGSGWMHSSLRGKLERGIRDGRLEPVDQATAERLVRLSEQRRAERG